MFNFNDYRKEIEMVQTYRNEQGGTFSLSDAFDMFRADVRAGKALPYNTGDALPNFDFAKAKIKWDKLAKAEQDAAVLAFEC